MAERLVKMSYPDHLTPGQSKDGGLSPLLFQDGKLSAHAALTPVDEERDLGGLLAGLALVGLTLGAVALAHAAGEKKESRREREWRIAEARRADGQPAVITARAAAPAGWHDAGAGRQRWWDGQEWTEHYQADPRHAAAPVGWYDDGSGRQRWWDGHLWTEHYSPAPTSMAVHHREAPITGATVPSTDVAPSPAHPRVSMSSAEWQERVRAMLLARAFSEEQWKLLSHARVEDADHAPLEWQRELSQLTAQQFADRINLVLEANSSQEARALEAASAGWYDDGAGRRRWWDGRAWTDQYDEEKVELMPVAIRPIPAGWYDEGSGRQRWWDGQRWADHWA